MPSDTFNRMIRLKSRGERTKWVEIDGNVNKEGERDYESERG